MKESVSLYIRCEVATCLLKFTERIAANFLSLFPPIYSILSMRALALPLLLLAVLPLIAAQLPDNASDLPISHLLSLAQSALSTGKTSDALSIYDYCLERDSTDFSTLYKRATVRLASGQYNRAKEGFHQVLQVREYEPARLQLGKIHAKLGEYGKAREELDRFVKASKGKDGMEKELKEANELVR